MAQIVGCRSILQQHRFAQNAVSQAECALSPRIKNAILTFRHHRTVRQIVHGVAIASSICIKNINT